MTSFDGYYLLGQVIKTHGLRGEVAAFLDVDFPEDYENMESVFVEISGQPVPFLIESITIRENKAYLAFEDITTLEEAEKLVGCNLYLPESSLPELPEGQYYFHQLIGFDFYNGSELLGQVREVYAFPTHHLLGIDHHGTEILVPGQEEIVHTVDLKKKEIRANLPDGLVDIYLQKE